MAKYTKIDSNSSDRTNTFNIMKSYLFGSDQVSEYSSSKTYNKGDKVYIVNIDGTVTVYTAKEDSITGIFNETKWTAGVTGTGTNSGIVISNDAPADSNVGMWIKPLSVGLNTIPDEL